MCDTPFKTPNHVPKYKTQKSDASDSDESVANSEDSSGSTELSIITAFDDLLRLVRQKRNGQDNLLDTIRNLQEQVKLVWLQCKSVFTECNRLQVALEHQTQDYTEVNRSLTVARKMLDDEKRKRKQAEQEVNEMRQQIDIFFGKIMTDTNKNKIPEDVRQQIMQLNKGSKSWAEHNNNQLDTIREVNSTGSILSDLSYSRSEDDLDVSKCFGGQKGWRKTRPSTEFVEEPVAKKRRSFDKVVEIGQQETVRATTTVTVNKKGPITATSVIESVPQIDENCYLQKVVTPNLIFESWNHNVSPAPDKTNLRQHQLQYKTVVMPDSCSVCEKRIRFGKSALRCKDCKSFCHPECKNSLPLPCVPLPNTPNYRKAMGAIGDYTPTCTPMVPALVVHCTNEIELRGLNEIGLYRIPGSEKDVKGLKERFLVGRGSPSLKDIDIHVLCGCVKDFLRSLTEPLVTYTLWKDFTQAVNADSNEDILQDLYRALSSLPQPNRDTLAYIILHLQRVANSPDCKMPIGNLSKIFGPTIVGYSSDDINSNQVMEQTRLAVKVMEYLLNIPSDYWSSFINTIQAPSSGRLQQTPSTDSLLRSNRIFTPTAAKSGFGRLKRKKEGKLFHTPPTFP